MPQSKPTASAALQLGGGELDLERAVLRRRAEEVALTSTEVHLLRYFLERPGVVVERGELLRKVWGYRAGVVSRAVDHAVKRLRAKIEADRRHPEHLITVTGRGYRFVLPTGVAAPELAAPKADLPDLPDPAIPRPKVDAWLDDNARIPGVCWLSGPPGCGKSRAAASWAHAELAGGRLVSWVACAEQTEADALWSATTLRLDALGLAVDSGLPILMVWDDTDGCEEVALVQAARETCRRLPAATLLLTRSSLRSSAPARQLHLPRLSAAQSLALLRLRNPSTGDGVSPALLDAVDHRPRALEELAPYLTMFPPDVLEQRARTGRLPASPDRPHGLRQRRVHESLQAHWRALTDAEQSLLSQCMAIPDSFPPMDIESLLEPEAPPPFAILLGLQQDRTMLPDPQQTDWIRVDPLLRRWWTAHAPDAHRALERAAHARRADALVQSTWHAWKRPHPTRLGELEHAAQRALTERKGELAARLVLRCGASWMRKLDLDHLTQLVVALDQLPLQSPDTRARWAMFRAEWQLRRGDRTAATTTSLEAIQAARAQDDPTLRSDICRTAGNLAHRLQLPIPTLELLDEAVDWGRRLQSAHCLASALSARGGHHIDTGRHADAEADINAAIHLFESLGEPAAAARCRGRIATLRKLAGRHEEALVLYRSATDQMADHAPPFDRATIRMNHANLLADLGRLEEATRVYEDAIAICQAGGEPTFEAAVRGSLATVLAEQQRHDEARLAFGEALRVHELNGSRKQAFFCILGLAELAMDGGDLGTAADLLAELDSRAEALGMPQLELTLLLKRAVWQTRSGDPEAALRALEPLAAETQTRRHRSQLADFLFAAGLACAAAGQVDEARAHATCLRRELRRMSVGPSSLLWRRLREVEDAVLELRRARGDAPFEPEE